MAQVLLALFAVLNPLVPALTTRTVGSAPHGLTGRRAVPAADGGPRTAAAVAAARPLAALTAALATAWLW
ncbi:hypothetical protein LUW77_02225 [Streptomyces radiopugnans]|nr:hypothetical protein LUW77_02225 [Streptomyces radiopugnans]